MSETKIIDYGTIPGESGYKTKTAEEMRGLALDAISGRILGSWMLREHEQDLMANVFMPLLFLNDIQRKVLERDNVIHCYGRMEHSTGMAINGLPMFTAVEFLDQKDVKRLGKAIKALQEFMATDIEEEDGDETPDA